MSADTGTDLKKTSVLLVDDNINFCVILAEAINRSESLICTRYHDSIKSAVHYLQRAVHLPSVILLDIKMPIFSGLDGIATLKRFDPAMHIVMLTSYEDENDIKIALQRGASGYLSKSSNHTDIIRSLERLIAGGKIIDPNIAEKIIESYVREKPQSDYHLSHREKEIIKYTIEGWTINQISAELKISFHTVQAHRRNIFLKLKVHNSHGLVAKAIQERLLD